MTRYYGEAQLRMINKDKAASAALECRAILRIAYSYINLKVATGACSGVFYRNTGNAFPLQKQHRFYSQITTAWSSNNESGDSFHKIVTCCK